ncbi:MAG: ABC transporter substrate-binding protein [Deltaproteobacteria bacterium]|nr:ABC transporter substrate-binding protein [Deltaproteobacteria bacterium]
MRSLLPALLAAASLLAGCEKKQPAQAPAAPATPELKAPAAPPPASDVILLGEVGSLTGAEATFGQSTHEGIQLALEQANAAGGVNGKKLEVRVYDDQGKPEEAANAAVRLINQDKVKLILGEVASTNSLAMADKAQAAKVPMVSPSSTNEAVTQKGDYIFRVCFIDPFQGYAMAKFARETLKLQNVAVLQDNKSAYSTGLTGVFQLRFAEMGGKVAGVESYSKGDTDFRAQLTALKKAKPDGIYIPGYYTDVGLIARQAQELGLKAVLLGGDGWESEKLFELGGSAVDGSYYTNHYSPDSPNPATQAFISAYKAKHNGKVPDSLAALAYDAANVAVAALRKSKSLEGPDIRDALAQTKDFDGAAGKLTLDEKRNATKPAVVLKVENGKAVFAASVSP